MSGRRRRDDGWDDGRRDGDARDNRADPWPVDSADGGSGRGYPAPSFQPLSEPATSYDLAAAQTANGNGYNSSSYGPGYRSETGYGGQNGAANGYPSAPSAPSAQPAPGYGGSGYPDSGYGQGGYGYGNDSGYGGRSGFADPIGATAYVPEFMSDDADDEAHDAPAGTPRPIGRLSIYTLLDDRVAEFDRLAERAAEGVRTSEPDTLVYVIHVVPKAPMQRIMYEIYRDRAAFESHERQPHIQRFVVDRASCVLATNIIDLRLKYAKVTALGAASAAGQGQGRGQEAQPGPGPLASAAGGDRSRSEQYTGTQYGNGSAGQYNGSAGQYGDGSQYNGVGQYSGDQTTVARPQYSPLAAPAAAAPAASFTPADDRYGTASQYPAAATSQYAAAGQYGYPGGAATANGSQYSAAAATAYPATSGYSETGAYPGTGYQAAGAYQATGGYAAGAGYSGGGGYSGGSGNSGGSGAAGSQASDGYQAANGYAGSNGYSATGNRASFTPVGSAGAATGQSTVAAQVAAARRYREIGSGAPADGGDGYQAPGEAAGGGYGGRDADTSKESAEWAPSAYSDQRYRSS